MTSNYEPINAAAIPQPGDAFCTSHTLLGRLQNDPQDQAAWKEFAEKYGRLIRLWCREWRLQDADTQDVTQNVLLEISRNMQIGQYRREGRFRYWLKTITYRAWCDYLKRQQRPGAGSGDSAILSLLNNSEARDDLLERLDAECRSELLEIAMQQAQQRVQENTFEAWRFMSLEGLSGAETAKRLGMNAGAVFVARSRVSLMLSEIVRQLDPDTQDQIGNKETP
jgi:RNA polymerase sigma factor (sigma-70 family)